MSEDSGAESLVGGRFRLLGLLGSGGTASVFEALDTTSGDRVALKLLHPHLAEDPALRAAFVREAEVLAGIRHCALCAPRDARNDEGDDEPRAWTAWDLAPGNTLAEVVRNQGPLHPSLAVAVVSRVLEGLRALHDAGFVHRDVSPSNVVVDLRGGEVRSVRIVDFGLVGPVGTSTRGSDVLRSQAVEDAAAGVVGNVSYASPEQLRGDAVGPASDLYGVAAVLYFAVVGEAPFVRRTPGETMRAHQTAVPPTASVRARRVPTALDRAIVRGMLKDPASRFATADEMRDAVASARGADVPGVDRTRVLGVPSLRDGTRFSAGASLGAEVAEPAAPGPSRTASPWSWVLATGAVALVVVVAIALIPRAAPVDAQEPPAPTASASALLAPPSPQPASTTVPSAPPAVQTVTVPAVRGLSAPDAQAAIEALGLSVGNVETADAAEPAGVILATSPDAGQPLEPGAAVSLVVASGANTVPALVGSARAEAEERLAAAGFGATVQPVVSSIAAGTVVDSDPVASTRLTLGVRVVLFVAQPPAPVHSPTPANSSPTPVPTR